MFVGRYVHACLHVCMCILGIYYSTSQFNEKGVVEVLGVFLLQNILS